MNRTGILTTRFDEAVAYALTAHDGQRRKGTTIPYAAHLLGVASTVLEAGGSEDEAIAALLHDVVEDQGGAARQVDVAATFGDAIAGVVQECSAEDKTDDPGWQARKQRYVEGLTRCSASALLIRLADKIYNARAILDDYRTIGPDLWGRFNAPEPKGASVLWYYEALVEAYEARPDARPRLVAELRRTVQQLATLMSRPPCPACGAGDVAPILWGMPAGDDAKMADVQGIEFGGCAAADGPAGLSLPGLPNHLGRSGPRPMVIVVSVLAIATVIVVPVCVAVAVRRLWRAVQQAPRTPQPEMPSLPYGALPPLGRVGALGEISPDANIGGTGTNSRDLYGA